jgi:hypothetical protein
VQVDATRPTLEIDCPATARVGQSGVSATVTASDGQSGLANDPSGTVPIDSSKAGAATIERSATVTGQSKLSGATGSVTVRDEARCAGSTFAKRLTVTANKGGRSSLAR